MNTKLNIFLSENYEEIKTMAQKITAGDRESEELAHYCILEFTKVKSIDEIVERGEGMKFMSGIMHRSFHSNTSPYYKLYRQKGKEVALLPDYEVPDTTVEYVDDMPLIERIEAIINQKTNDPKRHYRMTLLKEYVNNPNYSALSRKFNIPRTSLVLAIKAAREEVLNQLNK